MKYLLDVATLELISEKCKGCGTCVEVCPHGALAMNKKKVFITDRDKCMDCGACVNNCSFGALYVNKGVGCASAIINSMIYGGEPSCDCSGNAKSTNCC
jgi:NAD-dependent dihydropyrimidine dehydrogenase PreA subunit